MSSFNIDIKAYIFSIHVVKHYEFYWGVYLAGFILSCLSYFGYQYIFAVTRVSVLESPFCLLIMQNLIPPSVVDIVCYAESSRW